MSVCVTTCVWRRVCVCVFSNCWVTRRRIEDRTELILVNILERISTRMTGNRQIARRVTWQMCAFLEENGRPGNSALFGWVCVCDAGLCLILCDYHALKRLCGHHLPPTMGLKHADANVWQDGQMHIHCNRRLASAFLDARSSWRSFYVISYFVCGHE